MVSESYIYEIELPQFKGPFDLLLYFIERDELDIYDIPISKLTDDFLAYINKMQTLNIDLASEFILVAATLMKIKARMLLPRKELDEEGNEIDPRQDLIERLVEYKRYKEVLEELQSLEHKRSLLYQRGGVPSEVRVIAEAYSAETELSNISLYRLLKVFQKVLQRMDERKEIIKHRVDPFPYTLEQQREHLIKLMRTKSEWAFEEIFEQAESRMHAIFMFLALLDLVQKQLIQLRLGLGKNNFWLREAAA